MGYDKPRKKLLSLCPPTLGSILRLNGLALLLGKLYAYLPLDLRAAMLRGRKHTKEARQPFLYEISVLKLALASLTSSYCYASSPLLFLS